MRESDEGWTGRVEEWRSGEGVHEWKSGGVEKR